MSTFNLLLDNLPQTETATETHLAVLIEDFARSRTVEEIRADVRNMIANLDGSRHGITSGGFMHILRLGLMQGIDAAKGMFVRAKFDDNEWESLGPALQGL